jgi:trimethylamine--corrinoid protein Co-methyltransferase
MGALVGALSGINMISGSGMLDSLLCQSPEKLVVDAEGIAMAKRMLEGMKIQAETLATGFYEGVDFKGGDFLKQRITLKLFQKEQHLPGKVIDRDSMRGWQESGSLDTFRRAKLRVQEIIASYKPPELDPVKVEQLHRYVLDLAKKAGMDSLPTHDLAPVLV